MTRRKTDPNRGKPASFDRKTGEVHGSGANAGGGGNSGEDYDADPQGGGGAEPAGGPRPARDALRKPEDKHQGSPR